MPASDCVLRRARRTDFTAVMQLMVVAAQPVPVADRATMRRFRNMVNDLGADFYLAFRGTELVGLVFATHTRRLAVPPLVRVEQLVVSPLAESSTATALLDLVRSRAAKRGCSEWVVSADAAVQSGSGPLEDLQLSVSGPEWRARL